MRRAIAGLWVLTSCALQGDGKAVEVSREVPQFSAIEVFDEFAVEVRVEPGIAAETVTLRVKAEGNVMDRVFTEVHGEGVLSIAVNPNLLTELTLPPEVTMTVPALEGVFVSDRAKVRVEGAQGALTVESEAEGVIEAVALREAEVTVSARGRSQVMLAGTGPKVVITARENAHVDASRLAAEVVEVTVEGATATVTVCSTGAAPQIAGDATRVTVACEG
ncbi:MAG TPA: DUF2807 domain-containing protein [Nannocystis sp.]